MTLAARIGLAVGLAASVAACSNGQVVAPYIGRTAPLVDAVFPPALPAFSRADADQIAAATILATVDGDEPIPMVAIADNQGRVTYMSSRRSSLVLDGGLVVTARGFNLPLEAARTAAADPIATPTPLNAWPDVVVRTHYTEQVGEDRVEKWICSWRSEGLEDVPILELTFDLTRVVETCRTVRRAVVNTHWIDAETGLVWKSDQAIAPDMPRVAYEVIRPYARS